MANEVWFRKDFPGLNTGALVGVITFPKDGKDFRDQDGQGGQLHASLREDPGGRRPPGRLSHADLRPPRPRRPTTPSRVTLTFKELTKLSAKTSRSNHPSPMNLADTSAQKEFPAVAGNSLGHEVFFVKLKTAGRRRGADRPRGEGANRARIGRLGRGGGREHTTIRQSPVSCADPGRALPAAGPRLLRSGTERPRT